MKTNQSKIEKQNERVDIFSKKHTRKHIKLRNKKIKCSKKPNVSVNAQNIEMSSPNNGDDTSKKGLIHAQQVVSTGDDKKIPNALDKAELRLNEIANSQMKTRKRKRTKGKNGKMFEKNPSIHSYAEVIGNKGNEVGNLSSKNSSAQKADDKGNKLEISSSKNSSAQKADNKGNKLEISSSKNSSAQKADNKGNKLENLSTKKPYTKTKSNKRKKTKKLPTIIPTFNTAESADHCETPFIAYRHISQLLTIWLQMTTLNKATVKLYDPYYCNGSVVKHFHRLGYHHIFNQCRDFYTDILEDTIPVHDVLVTNPPYSSDNMEKLLSFCAASNEPFVLLLPHYVYCKEYFKILQPKLENMFYLVPETRYNYEPPTWAVNKTISSTRTTTSPFPSFWYCWFPQPKMDIEKAWQAENRKGISFSINLKHLPRSVCAEGDSRKRANPRARKRMAMKRRKQR